MWPGFVRLTLIGTIKVLLVLLMCCILGRWRSGESVNWASWSTWTRMQEATAVATCANSPPPYHSLEPHQWSSWYVHFLKHTHVHTKTLTQLARSLMPPRVNVCKLINKNNISLDHMTTVWLFSQLGFPLWLYKEFKTITPPELNYPELFSLHLQRGLIMGWLHKDHIRTLKSQQACFGSIECTIHVWRRDGVANHCVFPVEPMVQSEPGCAFGYRTSPPLEWTPKHDEHCGTASTASSKRDALSYLPHTGTFTT